MLKLFVFLFLNFFSFSFAHADVEQVCSYLKDSEFSAGYCVYRSSESKSDKVLYFFHGAGDSEYSWQQSSYHEDIYKFWGNKAPIVVSISYGYSWLLAEKNDSPLSGMFEHFITFAMPQIESDNQLHPSERSLMGVSMGGFNAMQIYLKKPTLFSKIALACPAISNLSPFATQTEVDDYVTRTDAYYSYVYYGLALSRNYFPTETDWNRADPIRLAKQNVNASFPPIYISDGDEDEFGFFEGAKILSDTIKANGASTKWKLLQGGHCVLDAFEMGSFLIQ